MWREKDITKEYIKGDVIIREGEMGKEMFIIRSGSVTVTKEQDGQTVILTTLKRGDFFGEMAILESAPRTATVTAREETRVVVLNVGSFLIKIRKDPTFAFTMLQKMSNRIRLLNNQLLKSRTGEDQVDMGIEHGVIRGEYLTQEEVSQETQ